MFVPIEENWIYEALDYFSNSGKDKLYFWTKTKKVGGMRDLGIKTVYFKFNGKDNKINAKADLVDITTINPKDFRLPGYEEEEGEYYYGFTNLRLLKNEINITELTYANTGNKLRNDVQGIQMIEDLNLE